MSIRTPAYWPTTSAQAPRPLAAATIATAPKTTTWTGSMIIRRLKEKLRWRIADGTEVSVCRRTTPDITAAISPVVESSKKAPISGESASAARLRPRPATTRPDRPGAHRLLDPVLAVDQGRGDPRLADQPHEPEQDRRGGVDPELLRGEQPGEDQVDDEVEPLGERVAAGGHAGAPDHRPRQPLWGLVVALPGRSGGMAIRFADHVRVLRAAAAASVQPRAGRSGEPRRRPAARRRRRVRVVVMIDSIARPGGGERLAVENAVRLDPDRFERTLCITRWQDGLEQDRAGRLDPRPPPRGRRCG